MLMRYWDRRLVSPAGEASTELARLLGRSSSQHEPIGHSVNGELEEPFEIELSLIDNAIVFGQRYACLEIGLRNGKCLQRSLEVPTCQPAVDLATPSAHEFE